MYCFSPLHWRHNGAENIFVIWVEHMTAIETVFPGHALIVYTQYCWVIHYNDIIMGVIASQITSLMIVYSTVYSDADQRKHQSSALLAFVWGIHQGAVNSPLKWPVTRKMFPFDDAIMPRASVVTALRRHPWISRCLWVNEYISILTPVIHTLV